MRTQSEVEAQRVKLASEAFLLRDKRDEMAKDDQLTSRWSRYFAERLGEIRARSVALNWVLGDYEWTG